MGWVERMKLPWRRAHLVCGPETPCSETCARQHRCAYANAYAVWPADILARLVTEDLPTMDFIEADEGEG